MKNNFLSLMGMRLKGRRMNDPAITRKSRGNHPVITRFGRMITSTLLLLFTFAIGNVWAANTPAAAGTYELKSANKPGNTNKFYKLGDGVYIHRRTNSSQDDSGIKNLASNDNGVAVYVNSPIDLSCLIKKSSSKNEATVRIDVFTLTNGTTAFDGFETGTNNSSTVSVTLSSSATYTTSVTFAALTSNAAEDKSSSKITLAAGYYYIVPVETTSTGKVSFKSITLTAAAKTDPTITFNNGAYTVGEALDLSTLFDSNSDGAVTYTVKTDGGTNASIVGTSFNASAAGTAVVTASQAATSTFNAATKDANIVVSVPSTPTHSISYTNLKGSDVSTYPTEYYEGTGIASFAPLADVADFHFTGWDPASISDTEDQDVEVEAQWVDAYNVSFSAGAGSGTVPTTFQKWQGAKFNLPGQGSMTAPSGKVFDGWKASGTKYAENAEYTMGNAEVEFVAQWKNTPTVLFHYQSDISSAPSLNTVLPATGGSLTTRSYKTSSPGSFNAQNPGSYATGTPDDMKVKSGKKAIKHNNSDVYLKLALTSGKLQTGDTIIICGYGTIDMFKSITLGTGFNDKIVSLTMSGTSSSNYGVNTTVCVIPQVDSKDVEYDSLCLARNSNGYIAAIKIIRPAQRDIASTVITLSDVKVNDHSISSDSLDILTASPYTLMLKDSYSSAPVIKFNEHTVINYVEGTPATKVTDKVYSVTATINGEGKWQAQQEINEIAYTVNAAKKASSDATLSSLTVNGEAITLEDGVFNYAFELPMGTTALPTIVAVPNDSHSKGVSVVQTNISTATITVTAEDDSFQDYTINFTVATSKDIELVWDKTKKRCDDTNPEANVKSDDASVSAYINKITFTGGGEGSSLNVGTTAGNMFTLSAKAGYALQAMSFFGKIQDATCEYSLDGGAWTELASTKTDGDKCYANIFSAAEVHEFRLRSTGTSGVWIRNMQLTIVEACTPIVLAWDEEPVEFEVGKSGYAIAATANNSGAVTYSSTDGDVIAVNGSTGALTVSALGSVTLKAATAEGDGTAYCANSGNDIEISKAVNTYYLVTFDGQNGEAADEVKYFSGDAAIAQPTDPSFPGHTFQGWFDAASAGNPVVFPLTPSASRTIYAQWTADCAGATITTQPTGASYLTGRTPVALVCEATAGAGGALTYEWFTCDDEYKANPVAATATPSTAVAGTFYYFCKVTEEGCAVEAFSNVVTITVADKDAICIIKSTPTSGTEATVDGVYQGNAYFKGRAADKKLNSQYDYVGVELASGYTFLATDKVVLNQTAALGTGDLSKFYVYVEEPAGGKAYATVLNASPVQGDNWFAMPTENVGQSTLYVGRVDANCNPSVGYLAVYRACAPILSKITVNSVEGTPDNTNHVTIEVPASTTQTQLEAIAYEWVSNSDAWTANPANAPVAANAWEFGVANTVTFTDKDGDVSVYTITVNKAIPSSDATLSTLSYGTPATAIALADGVYEYDVLLPYGTSDVPALAATVHHAGATIEEIDNATAFVDRKAASTVTVKAEDDATTQAYTVNFTVDRFESKVLWDGATMNQWSDITAAAAAAGVSVVKVGDDITVESKNASFDGKNYTKCIQYGGATSDSRNFGIVIPAGKVAKVSVIYRPRSTGQRSIIIGTAVAGAINESAIVSETTTHDHLDRLTADIFAAGTIYINTTNGYQVFEINVQLAAGHGRSAMLGAGVLGTVCVPNNVTIEDIQGVTVYELMGRESQYGKLAFDEIISGELEAGVPYVFQAHRNHMALLYGETHVANPVDKHNGMYGTFTEQTLTELNDVYYFAQKALWGCADLTSLKVPANRAYVKLSEVGSVADPNPAPGRRRISMAVNGEQIATGLENGELNEAPRKVLINGELYIIRGEKMYDAKGQLVK